MVKYKDICFNSLSYTIVLLILVALLISILSGCSNNDSYSEIYGVWIRNEKTSYTFEDDGKGTLGHGDHGHDFTFDIKDHRLTIRLSDSGKESEYSFVLEKDILSLTGINETKGKFQLTRKK